MCIKIKPEASTTEAEHRGRTTIEIGKKTRDLLRVFCSERRLTYDEALSTILANASTMISENSMKMLNLFCETRNLSVDDAIKQLVTKEIKGVVTTKSIDEEGNIITTIEER